MTKVPLKLSILINRSIYSTGHRKYVVDGINATNKRFLREKLAGDQKSHHNFLSPWCDSF